jgi:hypothetical protein
MSTSNRKPAYRVVSVNKREDKETFAEIGAAWPTASGGLVVRFTAHPLGDTVLLRPIDDKPGEA